MPTRGMYDTWISGSDVNSFCCYGFVSGFLVVFEKPIEVHLHLQGRVLRTRAHL